jgi:hypothetical protein
MARPDQESQCIARTQNKVVQNCKGFKQSVGFPCNSSEQPQHFPLLFIYLQMFLGRVSTGSIPVARWSSFCFRVLREPNISRIDSRTYLCKSSACK